MLELLAEKLKHQRKLHQKTQADMAKLLNVKRATYGEYERGNNLPPIDKLKIIAASFNVSIDYLIGNENQTPISITDTLESLLVNLDRIKDVPASVLVRTRCTTDKDAYS